ncbi:MAG: energy transducer TonB [Spirochaetes bacterium]|nr:energy transducer TonB [Spirochaetota bacterium]
MLTMLAMSMLVHIACLIQWPGNKYQTRQIILESRKADVTLINFSQIQLKWDEVEPVTNVKSDAGCIPSLFRKKERKIVRQKEQPQTVSLSAESIAAKDTYETLIVKRIQQMKYYPQFAKRMGNEGNVSLKFTLNKKGMLEGNVEIIKPCGYEILNNAGIITIKKAAPYPPFPKELSEIREDITFIVSVEYSLKHKGIR